jgi:hypothetical protein
VLAERTLANEHHRREAAECGATLMEAVLAREQRFSLLTEQAALLADSVLPATGFADDSDAAIHSRDATASAVAALAKDEGRQEEATAKQHQADKERIMVLDMPPNPIDAAIWRIWAKCALRTAPLDAILAKIACDNITHNAPAIQWSCCPPPLSKANT